MSNNQTKTHWLYLIGFFIILFLPLLSLPPTFSPPDWGKTIIFRIVFSILIFFFIYQIFSKKIDVKTKFKAIPKNLRILLISLLGIFFLATLFSQNISFSFWGSPLRSGGFLNFAFYIIFAFLAFIILKSRDWKKIWDFSFIIAILVGLVAIFQKYKLFHGFLLPYEYRPASTIGGPGFLALYLLLLTYLALSFLIKTKGIWKKFFYLFCALFFIFIIYLSGTRSVYLGGGIGILYFLLFYPSLSLKTSEEKRIKPKKIIWLKVFAGIIFILGISIVWWLNSQSQLPEFIAKNKLLKVPAQRLLIGRSFSDALDARLPGWKVGLQASKEKLILGYGPENFSIGFDKYYDPSLPYITQIVAGAGTGWWDRAHNFLLDISVTAGIPALIIYLSFFAVLFYYLQKIKKLNPEKKLICHGIQTTIIAYLAANFFGFDVFSSCLISFLLIGYSLYLIKLSKNDSSEEITFPEIQQNQRGKNPTIVGFLPRYRKAILFILFIILIWFIWVFNLKPLQINSQINTADYEANHGQCPAALSRMEKIIKPKSILDHYLRLKYVDFIGLCVNEKDPVLSYQLGLKARQVLQKNTKIMPTYTRNWIILGIYDNYLAEKIQEQNPSESQNFLKEADLAFEKAYQLSPKRQETFMEWLKTDLLSGQPEKAKEKAQQCLEINPEFRDCWWMLAVTNIYLNNLKEAEENIKIAEEKGYPIDSELSLLQKAKAYIAIKNYQALIKIYQKLIKIRTDNPQYFSSLATVFREAGDFQNARIYALKLLELVPSSKAEVEAFLQTLY